MRHALSERFHEILKELGDLHDLKQQDYGKMDGTDPFANVRAAEDFGLPGWVGGAIRMNDKMRRIQKAAQLGPDSLKFDSVEDDFRDMAVYSIICLVLLEELQCQKNETPRRPRKPTTSPSETRDGSSISNVKGTDWTPSPFSKPDWT